MLIIAFVMGLNTTIYSQNTQQNFEKAVGDYNNACEKLKTSEAEYAQTLQTDGLDKVF